MNNEASYLQRNVMGNKIAIETTVIDFPEIQNEDEFKQQWLQHKLHLIDK